MESKCLMTLEEAKVIVIEGIESAIAEGVILLEQGKLTIETISKL